MAYSRESMLGLGTDAPPDKLGDNAFYLKNMFPASPSSVRPRYGSTKIAAFSLALDLVSVPSSQRIIYYYSVADDPSMTVFVVCTSQLVTDLGGGDYTVESHIESIFEFYPGETVYSGAINTVTSISQFSIITRPDGFGINLPTGTQFGQRFYLYYPDLRPIVLMQVPSSPPGLLQRIDCGIQPPVAAPYCSASSTDATNLVYSAEQASLNIYDIGFSYFSSARNQWSQPSPTTRYTIPASPTPPKKILVNGFFQCRDNPDDNLIDYLVVGCRAATSTGLQAVFPDTYVPIANTTIGTGQITQGSFTLTGIATTFLTDLTTGDIVVLDGNSYVIASVADNTHATMYQAALVTDAGPMNIDRAPRFLLDLSPDQLSGGYDLNALASAMYIPPTVKYNAHFGEGIWLAGQRAEISNDAIGLTVSPALLVGTVAVTQFSATVTGTSTRFQDQLRPYDAVSINGITFIVGTISSQTSMIMTSGWPDASASNIKATRLYRGLPYARITSSSLFFTTTYLYQKLIVDGNFIGTIFDVDPSLTMAWLESDTLLEVTSPTTDWAIVGLSDRLWRSGYTTSGPGNAPATFPETVQLKDFVLFTQALDQGQQLTGLLATMDELRVAFDSCYVRMVGGNETTVPAPDLRQYWGESGCIAPRSLCRAPTGEMGWIGIEGVFIDAGSGPRNICAELGCTQLFRGGQWIARADIPTMVMAYSRELNAFIFANFTINGVAGWWGAVFLAPQYGIFLCDNQLFTSNLLEYSNGAGRAKMLAGDNLGRLKWFLDDETLLDISMDTDTPTSYICVWREGYNKRDDGSMFTLCRVRMPGIICPSPVGAFNNSLAFDLQFYRTNFVQRETQYLDTDATYTVPVASLQLTPDCSISLNQNFARYHSMAISYESTAGAVTNTGQVARPMEITQWLELEANE